MEPDILMDDPGMPSFDWTEEDNEEVVPWLEKSKEEPSDCNSELQTEDEYCLVPSHIFMVGLCDQRPTSSVEC